MLSGCIYGSVELDRCFGCPMVAQCEIRLRFVGKQQDRGPDASTNDFIYCRGEFDPYKKVRKVEIIRESDGYRQHIIQVRRELGLD